MSEDSHPLRPTHRLSRIVLTALFYLAIPIGASLVTVPALHVVSPEMDLLMQKFMSVLGGSVVVVVVGLALLLLAAWLRRRVLGLHQAENDRIAAAIMSDLRANPGARVPEFYLYLRAFETTGRMRVPLFLRLRQFSLGAQRLVTNDIESYVSSAIRHIGPLVALGRAGEAIGAGRIATDDDTWRADIRVLMDRAKAILVVPSNRPGTMWEIDTLKTANLLHKVIFIMPPRSKGDLDTRERWEQARQVMIGHGIEPPQYDDRGLLFEVGPDGRICNIEPMLLTSPRQVRKSLKRLLAYDERSGGFLKAAAKAERRSRRAALWGWAETARQLSPYAIAAAGLLVTRPEIGFDPKESWDVVLSRTVSARTIAEYDDSIALGASDKFRLLESQVPVAQREAWRTNLLLNGLMRVSDEDVRDYFNAFGQMLSRVDQKTCASITNGTIQPAAMTIAMTYMPMMEATRFLRVRTAAMLAEAEAQPLHALDPAAAGAANGQFLAQLGTDGQRRYQRIDQGVEPLTDDNRCWLLRAMYGGAGTLPEPHASVWARGLAAAALPNGGAAQVEIAKAPDSAPQAEPPSPRPPAVAPPAPQPIDTVPAARPAPRPQAPIQSRPRADVRAMPIAEAAPAPPQPQPAVIEAPPAPVRSTVDVTRPSYTRLTDDALTALRGGRFAEAGEAIDQLIRQYPDRGEGWSLRGLLAMDAYGDLSTARESYDNALARGTSVAFRLVHDHGNQQQFCIGTFMISPTGIEFTPESGDHRFQAPFVAIREAAINAVYGSQLGMFHIKAEMIDGTKNFNFVAVRPMDQRIVNRKPDAELLLRLMNRRTSR